MGVINECSLFSTAQARQQKAKPILDESKQWLLTLKPKVSPKSPLGTAITYSLKHWTSLNRYIDDGRLDIDNNKAERGIKPFVIGRKNWLFNYNECGTNAASILYSLIQTCKLNNVDVFAYFKYALDNIVNCKNESNYFALLPFNCDKSVLSQQCNIPNLITPQVG